MSWSPWDDDDPELDEQVGDGELGFARAHRRVEMPSMRVPRQGSKPKKAPVRRKIGARRGGRSPLLPGMAVKPHNNALRP